MLLENRFMLNLLFKGLSSDILKAHPQSLHADWMMLKNSSNQGGANSLTLAPWHTKSRQQMLVASKAVFLKNYLVGSTWILNKYSVECLEKKRVSTFQFTWCSIWEPGESNFWVKICLAQERTLFDFVAM